MKDQFLEQWDKLVTENARLRALNAELLAALQEVRFWFSSQMNPALRGRVESALANAEGKE